MRSALYLLVLLALLGAIACVPSVSAVVATTASNKAAMDAMAPGQVAILLNLTIDWPEFENLTNGMWTSEFLSLNGCGNLLFFTSSCNASGWLSSLIIDNPDLVGTFPDRFGDLEALDTLEVSSRTLGLTGTLPASWSKLSRLSRLSLLAPTLEGPIPASWSSMSILNTLSLTWAPTASVTTWTSGAISATMQVIQLSGYNFGTNGSFPDELLELPVIYAIYCDDCVFDGDLSAVWTHTTTVLQVLSINMRYGLESSLPPAPALPSDMTSVPITFIGLKNFPILGPLPSTLSPALTGLDLDNLPQLQSTLETGLFANHAVQLSLSFQNMHLVTGNVPLIGAKISPVILNDLGLNGTINSQIFSLSTLGTLRISSMPNMPPQSLPAATSTCGLQSLNMYVTRSCIHNCYPFPIKLQSNPCGHTFFWFPPNRSSINLQGSVPLSFSQYCAPSVLDLSYNGLSGTLPWVGTSELATLFLQNNSFVGQFPDALALQIMNQLNIENNQFSGTIPRVLLEGRLFAFAVAYNQINICASVNGTDFSNWDPMQCSLAPQTPTVCSCYLEGFTQQCWGDTGACPPETPVFVPLDPPTSPASPTSPTSPSSPSSPASPSSTPGSPTRAPTHVPTGSAVHARYSIVLMAFVATLVLLVAY